MTTTEVVLGVDPPTADDVLDVAFGARVRISTAARARMAVSRRLVEQALTRGDAVYGLTRRLGAGVGDPVEDQAAFQRQVVANHLGGTGEALPAPLVRAAMTVRLAGLTAGGAGVRPALADALAALLNAGVEPVVPERGSVGAADLVQLAAVAAVLVGDGRVTTADGATVGGAVVLEAAGLAPIALAAGEALALLGTNAFSVGTSAVLAAETEQAAASADTVLALSLQAAALHRPSGNLGPYELLPNAERGETGQARSAGAIRTLLTGSFLETLEPRAVQDELSFRVAPQVHGTLYDAADRLADAVDVELAARAENPLVDAASGTITPNGNFLVLPLALELESLRLVAAHVAAVSERRTAVLSALLRPFRAAGTTLLPGLAAYAAADALATVRQLAAPVTLSQSTLSEVEDHASLAWPAARLASPSLDALEEVLAIEALHAADLLRLADPPRVLGAAGERLATELGALLERRLPVADLVPEVVTLLADPS